MIDNIVIDSAIKITTTTTIAIWMKMLSMSYTLKVFFLTKLKAIYMARIVEGRSRKKRKVVRIVISMIIIIIFIWKTAEAFVVISPVMGYNHLLFLDSFQTRILIKDKVITKIHKNSYKYYQLK
jgi:hypothetical protein